MKNLQPYSNAWSPQNLRTLLNRTMMGYSKSMWKEVSKLSRESLVNRFLKERTLPESPINRDFSDAPYVSLEGSWVNKPYPRKKRGHSVS